MYTPCLRHLVGKSVTKLGPVDLSSDINTLLEASSEQEWY